MFFSFSQAKIQVKAVGLALPSDVSFGGKKFKKNFRFGEIRAGQLAGYPLIGGSRTSCGQNYKQITWRFQSKASHDTLNLGH